MTYHVVRSSERLSKRRCRRAWDLRNRQNWRPIVGPQALEFGTAYHAGMQTIYDPKTWDSTTPSQKLALATDAFVSCCEEQRDRYLLSTSQTRLTWAGRDDYASRTELGKHMLEYYALEVHPTEDVGIRPVKVEQKFSVSLRDADGEPLRCWNSPKCGQIHENGSAVVHDGRVDAIFEDIAGGGGYYIVDWKTVGGDKAVDGTEKNTGRFSQENLVWVHDQLNTYCWALRLVLNLNVKGFILAEIRKDYPRPPALLKHRRNGGIFSTNRNQSTTLSLFEPYVSEHDVEGWHDGAYDEYLEWLGSREAPIFHKRFRRDKTLKQLQQVGKNLIAEVREMTATDVAIYAEPGEITCKFCAFRLPCEMMMHGMEYLPALRAEFEQRLDDQ